MEWLQVLTIAGSTIGACYYFKRDSDAKLTKIDKTLEEIGKETKDFHGRLCTLEERYYQMMHRILEERRSK